MTTDKKQIRRRIWDSLEVHYLRRDMILYVVILVVFLFITCIRQDSEEIIYIMLAAIIVTAPFIGIQFYRIGRLFRKIEHYTFHKCTLERPHSIPFMRMLAFHVVINEGDDTIFAETHAIFAPCGMMEPLMENYTGRTVTIAYNSATDQVAVIG